MSRNFNQNIIEYWRRLDFTRNVSDIINDQRRDRLGERDLKNLFTIKWLRYICLIIIIQIF